MPLETSERMLSHALENNYAIAAFNCENMEMIQAVISAAEEMNAPVIIQTTPSTIRYASVELYAANVIAAAKDSPVPIALHLDHGDSMELVENAVRAGYSSIMIDGSKLKLEENAAFTKGVVDFCRKIEIPVEGELGRIGGKEDETTGSNSAYTDPEEAVYFVNKTGVSSLAIGIGTAHGIYKERPVLKPELITEIHSLIKIPLVLHGSSGLEDEAVKDCISRGINKVNFATDLRIAYTKAVKNYLEEDSGCIDPKKFGKTGREAVKILAKKLIILCGSNGRA